MSLEDDFFAATAAEAVATAAPLIDAPTAADGVGLITPACNVLSQADTPPNLIDQKFFK